MTMMHAPMEQSPRQGAARTSDILETLFAGDPDSRVNLADVRKALEDRAFGFLILVLVLPNCLPIPGPPGLSAVLGVPVCFLALQMVWGQRRPWLPRWLLERSVRRGDCTRLVAKSAPLLRRLEKLFRPRLPALNSATADRVNGALLLVFAIILSLPIPLGNLPPAYAVLLMALGIIEQDGLAILIGIVTGIVSVLWAVFLAIAGVEIIDRLWHFLF